MSSYIKRYSADDVVAARRPGLWIHAGDFNQAAAQAEQRELALQQRLNAADHRLAELQADLTKAREAITKIAMWPDGGNAYGQDRIKAFANRILSGTELNKATEISHQSAPAAKGDSGQCWSCRKPVTLAECQEADGECPHCRAEIHSAEELKS